MVGLKNHHLPSIWKNMVFCIFGVLSVNSYGRYVLAPLKKSNFFAKAKRKSEARDSAAASGERRDAWHRRETEVEVFSKKTSGINANQLREVGSWKLPLFTRVFLTFLGCWPWDFCNINPYDMHEMWFFCCIACLDTSDICWNVPWKTCSLFGVFPKFGGSECWGWVFRNSKLDEEQRTTWWFNQGIVQTT